MGRKSQFAFSSAPWEHDDFTEALNWAEGRGGPASLTNNELIIFCQGAFSHFEKLYWKNLRPFFVELWRRLECHEIRGIRTKAEACDQIGCSIRWAQMIVAGTAKDSNRHKAKGMRRRCAVSSRPAVLTDEEYADEIARYADSKLEDLRSKDWERFQVICNLLRQSFHDAATGWNQ